MHVETIPPMLEWLQRTGGVAFTGNPDQVPIKCTTIKGLQLTQQLCRPKPNHIVCKEAAGFNTNTKPREHVEMSMAWLLMLLRSDWSACWPSQNAASLLFKTPPIDYVCQHSNLLIRNTLILSKRFEWKMYESKQDAWTNLYLSHGLSPFCK